MRPSLFYNPELLCSRIAEEFRKRRRLRRLRGTCASWLTFDHIDTMELIDLAAADGARVFYDIGANVGSWALLARALVPDCNIIGIEPMEEHLPKFREHTSGLERITLLPLALGSTEAMMEFHPASFSDASSFLPLKDEGKKAWHIENTAPRMMKITTLDAVITAHSLPAPDLMKLDVQGFELEVLKGATSALEKCRWVLCEVSFTELYAGQCLFSDVAAFLAESGFEVHAFGERTPTGRPLLQADVLFTRNKAGL
jgi:FkbM family methyltransferase